MPGRNTRRSNNIRSINARNNPERRSVERIDRRENTGEENVKKFLPSMKKKLVILLAFVLLAFIGLSIRLILINRNNGETYKKQILSQQNYNSTVLPFKRGDILDAQGSQLAYCEKVYNLVLDAKLILQKKGAESATLKALDTCFDLDIDTIKNYLDNHPSDQYYVVAKQLTYEQIEPFQTMMADVKENPLITGVWFEEEYKRIYPYGSLACDAIGFTVDGNTGTFGLEEYYNDTLNGTNGREYGYLTEGSMLERSTKSATDGKTIVSTIDANIQSIVEKYILQWNQEHEGTNAFRAGEKGSHNTGVIVMNPKNGDVLAMASYPTFDLNNPRSLSENGLYTPEQIAAMDDDTYYDALNELWRNFCISDTYEPGSTAKSMTISAALDSGVITGDESYYCGGVLEVGGHQIHCHKRVGHGMLTVSGALEQSCNVALMQIGSAMGNATLMKYLAGFNIGLKTNIDLAGEARTNTLVYDPDNMATSDLAISTFGQGYNVTMIQLCSAFCSIVNGGYYYQPHMVSEIRNADGATVEKIEPRILKQTISETTSDRMREYLGNVCSIGTGTAAVPAGYRIGGKTGTSEKYPRGTENYVVSFVGFAPQDDPQVVVYVVIDSPNVDSQPHSSFAQDIAKNIFTEVLPYMQVFRTEEITPEDEEHLKELGILNGGNILDQLTGDDTEKEDQSEDEEPKTPEVTMDPATGYAIDPTTGELLNPSTYEPVDDTSSDLGGIGALVDDNANGIEEGNEGGE